MFKYMIAFVLTFGLLIVGFSTPASATCDPNVCDVCETNVYGGNSCVCECTNFYKSRGDCISSQIASNCQNTTGQDKKDCVADAKDFCDCAVYNGCTDLPPGPPPQNI